ncbi:hypothetical protein HK105_204199 [Polyrhizophydium stewartii]|uniref:L domain-like protein n=1 Tax=Polyrhizophydium stewartii TaxID=2732419 RepID=A0ABR4N9A2_9FUNG|nr:hypothetical protein HK105_006577 [Polyrhizophydium stewartii]
MSADQCRLLAAAFPTLGFGPICCNTTMTFCENGVLTQLSLGSLNIGGQIPYELGSLNTLVNLALFNNSFTSTIPESLGNLTKLEYLSLDTNHLTGGIPSSFANLVNLKELWLYTNNLTGPIPPFVGNMRNLRNLSLDDNRFSGQIPDTIGQLKNLVFLGLTRNELSGQIPTSIGSIPTLTKLHFGNNFLNGSLPYTLNPTVVTECDGRGTLVCINATAMPDVGRYCNLAFCQDTFSRPQFSRLPPIIGSIVSSLLLLYALVSFSLAIRFKKPKGIVRTLSFKRTSK